MPRLFCFGLGYTAARLASRLAARGFTIAGTTRDPERRRATLAEAGQGTNWTNWTNCASWTLVRFGGDEDRSAPGSAELERALEGTTHLLHSIMPDADGDLVLQRCGAQIDALTGLRWTGYLSTTGVYGDHGGAWIDEAGPRRADSPRTLRRVSAEDRWLERGADVFRLAGIYGPGRSALERVCSGRARRIVKPGKVFNRIHVDDAAAALEAAIFDPELERGAPSAGRVFNVADGHPASSAEVLTHAAELLRVAAPPEVEFEHAEMSPMARSFWRCDVRVDNARLLALLGRADTALRYPDYRAGLAQCLERRSL